MSNTTTTDLNASLSSLALLSVQFKEGKDYLDYLHGFVIGALGYAGIEPFDAAMVQKLVEQHYGLRIPAATFAIYLKRLAKLGVVTAASTEVQFRVAKLPPTTVDSERELAKAKIAEVTEELAGYAHSKFERKWDERDSSAAIAEFLRQYSIDFLRFIEAKSPLPKQDSVEKAADYIVASFVTHCAKNQPGLFESIKVLVQSHILANALMCSDLRDAVHGFTGVHFFVDTRFVIKALDLESEYESSSARSLLTAIRKLKGVVCIFPETKNELQTVLRAIIRGIQQGQGRGPVYRELLRRRRAVTDVILAESNLDATLASLSISTHPSPAYDENNYKFQIDETQLRDEIEGEVDYLTDKAADHDIRVVRHIFALRKGRTVPSIEKSGYVFLTTNAALSRAAFAYERKNSSGWIFSAVVTDYHLSHLAWLKSPMQAEDLPRAELLASCYAAMRPNEALWRQYLSEVDRLKAANRVSAKDHEVLRFSVHAPDEVMNVTRGDVEGITEANVNRILEKLEKSYAADKQQQLDQIQQEHEATKTELILARSVLGDRSAQLVAAAEREESLKQAQTQQALKLAEMQQAEQTARVRDNQRKERVDRLANQVATTAFVLAGLMFAFIGALSVFSNVSPWLGVPAAIGGVLNIATGFSGNTIKTRVRGWVSDRVGKFVD